MFLSPPEIQHQKLKSRLGSYDREDVDELLEDVVASYEQVWHERDEAQRRIAELQQELHHYQDIEHALRDSLVTGQRAAHEVKSEAEQQAELLLEEARRKAEAIVSAAEGQRERVNKEIARLRGVEKDVAAKCRDLLVGALEAIGQQEAAEADSERRPRAHEVAGRR